MCELESDLICPMLCLLFPALTSRRSPQLAVNLGDRGGSGVPQGEAPLHVLEAFRGGQLQAEPPHNYHRQGSSRL